VRAAAGDNIGRHGLGQSFARQRVNSAPDGRGDGTIPNRVSRTVGSPPRKVAINGGAAIIQPPLSALKNFVKFSERGCASRRQPGSPGATLGSVAAIFALVGKPLTTTLTVITRLEGDVMANPRDYPYARAVGVAWYRKEDYPALIAIFEDGPLFDSYEEWRKRAEEAERELQRDGYVVERVYIDPDTFPEWCSKEGFRTDREGRGKFAAEAVEKKYGRDQS
jgi:hypothetical protein